MRTFWCRAVAVAFVLAAVGPIMAQNILGRAASPNLKPPDAGKFMKTPSLRPFKPLNVAPSAPTLSKYFPRFSLAPKSFPSPPSATPILDTKNNPFQPKPPKGTSPFTQKSKTIFKP